MGFTGFCTQPAMELPSQTRFFSSLFSPCTPSVIGTLMQMDFLRSLLSP